MESQPNQLAGILSEAQDAFNQSTSRSWDPLKFEERGTVTYIDQGIVRIKGLPHVTSDELVRFPNNIMGVAFNLDVDDVGVILLDEEDTLEAGFEVERTGKVLEVPVGKELLGRVVDALGRPLDWAGPVQSSTYFPVERPAPSIMDRDPVAIPLQTGIKVVDALIPIGRGQRELILGDRQTGKTTVAVQSLINQTGKKVISIYCAIGQRSAAVNKVLAHLKESNALKECIVVATTGDDPPGLRYVAPYAAMSMGEYFRDQGEDVLIVFDDLSRHARAYREISLLLRRPPGREAFPGDIFYIHSRLLERSTRLRREHGGGSLTALPIIETEAQNISAYVPTNLISITDGQIYLSPDLFDKGVLPAVDVGKSVSRVGGQAQLPVYREMAGDLRLSYSQFNELESFSRFSTRLDERTRKSLERGRRVREILKQPMDNLLPVAEQVISFFAVNKGYLDEIPIERIGEAEGSIHRAIRKDYPELARRIEEGTALTNQDSELVAECIQRALQESQLHSDQSAVQKASS